MRRMIYTLFFGAIATLASFGAFPAKVQADRYDYWNGSWSRYDRDYRPYYSRRYYPSQRGWREDYYRPMDRAYYGPYRDYGYYYDGRYPVYVAPRGYYREYYYGPRGRVSVEPVPLRWY